MATSGVWLPCSPVASSLSCTTPASSSREPWIITKELDDLIGGLSVTVQNGVLGKWKYAEELDAFIALEDAVEGNVWAYKPFGWQAAAVPLPGAYALFAGGLLLVAATARRRA